MQTVGKGAVYLYAETMLRLLSAYLLWILLSKLSTPEIIGTSATVISLASILATIASLGVPMAIPRLLGKSFSENDHGNASRFAKLSVLIVSIGTVLCSFIVFVTRDWVYSDLSTDMMILSLLLLASIAIATLLRSIMIATLEVKILPIFTTVSSLLMVTIAISLVLLGAGAVGVVIAYICFHTIFSVLLCFSLAKVFGYSNNHENKIQSSFSDTTRNILRTSLPSWIPALIAIIGSGEVGTIALFGSVGPGQAGTYYLAYTIFSALAAITYSIFSIAFPMLSGMHERRKEVLWKFLKSNLILSLPISSVLIFYADNVMILFGRDYALGSDSLQIFLVSIFPISLFMGITTLVYAYGNYRQVLMLGLSLTIPRLVFYFILIAYYGSTGAALSFTIGSITGFIASVIVSKRIGLLLYWKDILILVAFPLGISFAFKYSGINYLIGIFLSILVSYLVFLRLGVLTREDIGNILGLIMPAGLSRSVLNKLDSFRKRSDRS